MTQILLVEDDREGADAIRQYLEFRGFAVDAVGSGEAAVLLVRDHRYDVVLTDLHLPGMRGDELATRLLAQADPPKLIALSGEHGPIGRAPFDARLPKPCQPKHLVETIVRLLSSPASPG
jgi:CheY-like chemotaxis protein